MQPHCRVNTPAFPSTAPTSLSPSSFPSTAPAPLGAASPARPPAEPCKRPGAGVRGHHASLASAGRGVVAGGGRARLRAACTPGPDPGRPPAGCAQDPRPTPPGRGQPSTCQPQVQEEILRELLRRLQFEQLNDFSNRGQRWEAESAERPGGRHEPPRGQSQPHADLSPPLRTHPAEEGPGGLGPASGLTSLVGSIRPELERGQEIRALSARRRSVGLEAEQVGGPPFRRLSGAGGALAGTRRGSEDASSPAISLG